MARSTTETRKRRIERATDRVINAYQTLWNAQEEWRKAREALEAAGEWKALAELKGWSEHAEACDFGA